MNKSRILENWNDLIVFWSSESFLMKCELQVVNKVSWLANKFKSKDNEDYD